MPRGEAPGSFQGSRTANNAAVAALDKRATKAGLGAAAVAHLKERRRKVLNAAQGGGGACAVMRDVGGLLIMAADADAGITAEVIVRTELQELLAAAGTGGAADALVSHGAA